MRRIVLQTLFVAATFLLAASSTTVAKTIYVDDDALAPGDGTSWATACRFLQDALTEGESAEKPVEIRVARGLYKPDRSWFAPEGTGNTEVKFRLVDGMSLLGGYAGVGAIDPNVRDFQAFETVLSGDLAGNDAEVTDSTLLRADPTRDENSWQVIFIRNGQSRLEGFTITGGTAGGVFVDQYPRDAINDVTVSDCKFYGNRGSVNDMPSGGALTTWLEVVEAKVVFRRCSFVGNAGDTGAIRAYDVVLDQCRFERNYSWGEWGGAASVGGNSTVSDCVFIDNSARRAAGALYVSSPASDSTRVSRCKFRGNSAGKWGGGLVCDGNVDVQECVFTANEAGTRGGAGYDLGSDAVRIRDCVLTGNRAGQHGGAWFSSDRSSLELAGCTVVENRAPEGPFLGVDYNTEKNPSHVVIRNCVLSNGGDEIWSDATPVNVTYTCFGAAGSISAGPNDWLELGTGNIDADPCLVDAGRWDANGTPDDPNDDFFVEGDYHLKSQAGRWDQGSEGWVQDDVTSPCIDAGDPNSPVGDEPFPNGGIINMGAYGGTAEASMSLTGEPTEGQWTEPTPLHEINTDTAEEWSPFLAPDGLTFYFGRVHSPNSHLGRIFQATRSSPSGIFTSITEVPGPLNDSDGHVLCQWVSPDDLRMYYMFQVNAIFSLKVSERASTSVPWPAGSDISELNRFGTRLAAPYLTADERIIFFSASDFGGTIGDYDTWMATRPDRADRFGEPVNVEPINTTFNEIHPFVMADGLTLYFASDRNGCYQLFRSTRNDLDSPFGSPVHMMLFDTPDGDSRFPFLAADGSTFYFQRETSQDRSTRDIWVAYRID